jgi:hypothetical protein
MKHPINVALIKLAQRWGYWDGNTAEFNDVGLEEFAAAIRASEREKLAQWMISLGYATGHGDTMEALLDELGTQIAEGLEVEVIMEREACAKVCESRVMGDLNREDMEARRCAEAIRARGEK